MLAGALVCVLASCSSQPKAQLGDPCKSLSDCAAGQLLVCNEHVCDVVSCTVPEDCPDATACVHEYCAPPECSTVGDCKAPATCWEGACLEGVCRSKEDCPAGKVCQGRPPQCVDPPEHCQSDDDCPVGHACATFRAACRPACADDADCGHSEYCLEGACVNPCRDDTECPADFACADQRCQKLADCSDQPACGGLHPYRDPLTCACVACLDDTQCDHTQQEACTGAQQCVYCPERATSPSDCASQGRVFVDGCCAECADDGDCPSAQAPYCDHGRCAATAPPACIAQNDCDAPKVCDQGRCVAPPSYDACQLQSDCPDGEACYADGLCRAEAATCGDCPAPSRCVAEPGDQIGTCAGCTTSCAADGCPTGQICVVDDGAREGYCVDATAAPQCQP